MPPEENKTPPVPEKKLIKALRTYQGDVEEILGKKKISKTTILVAEQERKGFTPTPPRDQVDTRKRNRIFIWSGILLFILGIMTVSAVYYVKSINQVVIEQKTKTIMAFSEESDIPVSGLTRENLIKNILAENKSFSLPLNSVLYINITNSSSTSISSFDFLSLLAPQIPRTLLRSFEDEHMLGILSFDANEPFIILTTKDFATSYSGMLIWERNIISDIGPIFGINGTASTTTFVDEERQNKDLRVMKDLNGKTMLVYSFIDRNTLVITSTENILAVVVGKYIISKQAR